MTFVKVEASVTTLKISNSDFKIYRRRDFEKFLARNFRVTVMPYNTMLICARDTLNFLFQISQLERDRDPGRIAICNVVLSSSLYNSLQLICLRQISGGKIAPSATEVVGGHFLRSRMGKVIG